MADWRLWRCVSLYRETKNFKERMGRRAPRYNVILDFGVYLSNEVPMVPLYKRSLVWFSS